MSKNSYEKELTILTAPVGLYYTAKDIGKKIIKHINYGGHAAVTRSLIEGLDKIGYDRYNYQPTFEKDIAQNVHVLAGVKTLEYAIELKKKGKIKRLTAGPNIVVFSTDYNSLIADENIDLYLQPSQWAADLHVELEPKLKDRCIPWAAGIDISKFTNTDKKKKNYVLIYHKDESNQFCYRVDYLLRKHGFQTVIIKYGSYKFDDYIRILSEVEFAVVISRQESQGICLAEAWAMDVPTICFDPHYYRWSPPNQDIEKQGNISTCPYLTEKTGVTYAEMSELEEIISNWDKYADTFSPREWAIANMSDEVCARDFLKKVLI